MVSTPASFVAQITPGGRPSALILSDIFDLIPLARSALLSIIESTYIFSWLHAEIVISEREPLNGIMTTE